jgi:Clostridial hydrophobic W
VKNRTKANRADLYPDALDAPRHLINGDRLTEPHDVFKLSAGEDDSEIAVRAQLVRFDPGLYALAAAAVKGRGERAGIALPAVHISIPPSQNTSRIEILARREEDAGWLGPEAATVVIKVPETSGYVLVTTYEDRRQPASMPDIIVRRIDAPASARVQSRLHPIAPATPTLNVATEVLLHIQGTGDRRVPANGWVGSLGKKLRLEAFSIRPLEMLLGSDIEYKAYGPNGRETPWIRDGELCGTRGRSLPLTGFAVRLAAHQSHRFGIEYRGAFFESGVCGPIRDGNPCIGRIADDPLEAINLRFFQRVDA